MKIIYNDRELMINASKNISTYNLLLICLKKLGVPLQNITNFIFFYICVNKNIYIQNL